MKQDYNKRFEEYVKKLINIDEIIGKPYIFDDMCEWSKETNLQNVGKMCCHNDCHKAFWINNTKAEIRGRLEKLVSRN